MNQSQTTDQAFESLNWGIFRMLPELTTEKTNNAVVIRILFFMSIILLFVGDEAVKMLFRTGFGKKGIHWWKAMLCILSFASLGATSIAIGVALITQFQDFLHLYFSLTFFISAIFHFIMAAFFIKKWLIEKRNLLAEPLYRGDSSVLAHLKEKGWSQAKIQNIAEPRTLLYTGLVLCLVNPIIGAPLMICAISSWMILLLERFLGLSAVRDRLAEFGYRTSDGREFSFVRPDVNQ